MTSTTNTAKTYVTDRDPGGVQFNLPPTLLSVPFDNPVILGSLAPCECFVILLEFPPALEPHPGALRDGHRLGLLAVDTQEMFVLRRLRRDDARRKAFQSGTTRIEHADFLD